MHILRKNKIFQTLIISYPFAKMKEAVNERSKRRTKNVRMANQWIFTSLLLILENIRIAFLLHFSNLIKCWVKMCQWDFKKMALIKRKQSSKTVKQNLNFKKKILSECTKKNNIFTGISNIYVISTCGVFVILVKAKQLQLDKCEKFQPYFKDNNNCKSTIHVGHAS